MISAGFEPQWYITQLVVITTRPLARCWKETNGVLFDKTKQKLNSQFSILFYLLNKIDAL
jgi:hypothetical protein